MFSSKSPLYALVGVLLVTVGCILMLTFLWNDIDFGNPFGAITVNFMLMTWAALCSSLLNPTLDSPYFDAKSFEQDGAFYRKLGVPQFRTLLLKSGYDSLWKRGRKSLRTLEGLQEFERTTRLSEASHVVIAVIVFGFTVWMLVADGWLSALWFMLSNLLFNVYPVMLQRYNRPKTQRHIREWVDV